MKNERTIGLATLVFTALAALGLPTLSPAETLRIGVGSEATTMDPHFYNLGPNTELTESVFDRLVHHDENLKPIPGLAESWSVADDGVTWTFKLRRGVKFHDGSDFDSKDVLFSFERLPKVENSPSSFEKFTRTFADVKAVDDFTLQIKTKDVTRILLNDLEQIAIVPDTVGMQGTDAYNTGEAMIGTGPYRFKEWKRGDSVILTKNDGYWGDKPQWDTVIFKALTNNTSRTAALLSGDVDVISFVPTVDIKRLKTEDKISVYQRAGNRLLYYHLDQVEHSSPHVFGKDGKPLEKNPLADVRVRKALSKGINRDVIVERIMDGVGIKASQMMADHFIGTSPALKPEPYDPEGAKRLLAEAGYPDGFGLTVHGPNNRYPNDHKIVQATAQMLTRIGIDAKVETYPKNVYFGRASKREFSMMLIGSAGNSPVELQTYILNSYNKAEGLGAVNRGRYSNPRQDELLAKARVTLDDDEHSRIMADAVDIAIRQDQGILPILYFVNSWATRKPFVMHPQAGDHTRPMDISKE